MNFEEMQNKLQWINNNFGRKSEQELLVEFNKIYEKAKGEEELAEDLVETIKGLKQSSKDSKSRKIGGILTDLQVIELEAKANKIEKAIKDAKELRENSDKDKIDAYVEGKIKDSEEEIAKNKAERVVLEGQKERLEGPYKDYQENKKKQEICKKIEKLAKEIEDELSKKDSQGKKMPPDEDKCKKKAEEITSLMKDEAVKKDFVQNSNHFETEVDTWDVNIVNKIKTNATKKSNEYGKATDSSEKLFNTRIDQVPPTYKNTPVETFLEDTNKKYKTVEEKWVALLGRLNEKDKKIQEIEARNDAYKQYAKDIKEKAEVEEKQQLSDEELAVHDDVLQEMGQDEEMQEYDRDKERAERHLDYYRSMDSSTIPASVVKAWLKEERFNKKEGKAERILDEINMDIEAQKGPDAPKATMADLMYNSDIVKEVRPIRTFFSKIKCWWDYHWDRNVHRKDYQNYLIENSMHRIEALEDGKENHREEIKTRVLENAKERYRYEVEQKANSQQEFVQNMYKSAMGAKKDSNRDDGSTR